MKQRWVGHVVHMRKINTHKTFIGTHKVKDHLEDISIDWRMTLKYICKKQDDRMSTGLMQLWIETTAGPL